MAVDYVCERCGSRNVTSDTVSHWDIEMQRWVIVGHYDSSECHDCQKETRLEEIALPAIAETETKGG